MLRSPKWLAAIIAALLVLFGRETPALAFSRVTPLQLGALPDQPPGADNADFSEENRSEGSQSGGGTTSRFAPPPVPSLEQFVKMAQSGKDGSLTGIYVPDTLALTVLPADPNDPLDVTLRPGTVTRSCGIRQCPGVGLVAHNLLAGALFFRLAPGQEVDLVYGGGSIRRYRVVKIRRYQALSPKDPYSSFVDLEAPGRTVSSTDVFRQTFGVPDRVVLQTCIAANGDLTWGRLFVIAEPQ